ncbi:LysR family transcriptional regulator [Bartonella sp. LJL80]
MTPTYPRIKNLNWNLLRTFLVIVEEGSITRAADRLLVRQPTVTTALQKLEETLGCQLIQRDSRRFVLTSHGEILRQECLEITRRVERIGQELIAVEDGLTGMVHIQLVTHIPVPALEHAMRQMRSTYPSVAIEIAVSSSQDIIRGIAQKQFPFGFCLLQKPVASLACHYLYREEFGIYCGSGHILYGQKNVAMEELRKEAFISFACAEQGQAFEPMIALRDGVGLGAWTVGSSRNLEEVHRMIAAGIGIGLLPKDVVADDVKSGRLWLLSTFQDTLGADVYFVRNPDMKPTPAERAFLDIYQMALFDLGKPIAPTSL